MNEEWYISRGFSPEDAKAMAESRSTLNDLPVFKDGQPVASSRSAETWQSDPLSKKPTSKERGGSLNNMKCGVQTWPNRTCVLEKGHDGSHMSRAGAFIIGAPVLAAVVGIIIYLAGGVSFGVSQAEACQRANEYASKMDGAQYQALHPGSEWYASSGAGQAAYDTASEAHSEWSQKCVDKGGVANPPNGYATTYSYDFDK